MSHDTDLTWLEPTTTLADMTTTTITTTTTTTTAPTTYYTDEELISILAKRLDRWTAEMADDIAQGLDTSPLRSTPLSIREEAIFALGFEAGYMARLVSY